MIVRKLEVRRLVRLGPGAEIFYTVCEKKCVKRCAKNRGAARCCFCAIGEKPEGGGGCPNTPLPGPARVNLKLFCILFVFFFCLEV